MPTNPYGDDPNLDSQGPRTGEGDQSDPNTQASITQKVNDVVRMDPVIASWLKTHNNGAGLSASDLQALKSLVSTRTRGQIQDFDVASDGTLQDVKAPDTFWKTLAIGSAAVIAPIVFGALLPAAGAAASGSGGVEAGATSGLGAAALPGAGTALPSIAGAVAPAATALGPSTAANIYGTAAATAAPASIAAPVAAAAGTAAKGISSWLAPVLQGVVPTVGSLIGATIAAGASKDASAANAESIKEALDFEKQQYSDLTGRLAPYVSAGTASSDRMSQLLGLPARSGTTATAPPTRGPAVNNYGGPSPAAPLSGAGGITSVVGGSPAPGTTTGGPMVTLQAPDGTTKQVPQEQVAHYQALGAKVLGAAA